jgi:hypothetical protein
MSDEQRHSIRVCIRKLDGLFHESERTCCNVSHIMHHIHRTKQLASACAVKKVDVSLMVSSKKVLTITLHSNANFLNFTGFIAGFMLQSSAKLIKIF